MKGTLKILGLAGLLATSFGGISEAKRHQVHRKPSTHVTHKKANTRCNLAPARAPPKHLENVLSKEKATIYFPTNNWMLYENDISDLRNFYCLNKGSSSITVEGHADPRGTDGFNMKLGEDRARGVEDYLRGFGYNSKITVTSFGETKPAVPGDDKEAYKKDRRVEVLANSDPITRALEVSKADVYLIDATGSMMQNHKWESVRSYKYPNDSKIFGFNECMGLIEVKSLNEIRPDCYTPLWDSIYKVIEKMQPRQTLTVLTDGLDNASNVRPEAIVDLAKSKKITLKTIAVGIDQRTADYLGNIASQTGGSGYKIN